jgi:phosphohistidine phosphatase
MGHGLGNHMKRLILIRHAQASWGHPELDDFERPLTKRGERDARVMGRRLAHQQIKPDVIIASPAHRAIRTAALMAKEVRFPITAIVPNQDLYAADVSELMSILQQLDDAWAQVMVVGHNPGLTRLSASLTHAQVDPLPPCGVFCVDLALASWKELAPGSGAVVLVEYPKLSHYLRDLRALLGGPGGSAP